MNQDAVIKKLELKDASMGRNNRLMKNPKNTLENNEQLFAELPRKRLLVRRHQSWMGVPFLLRARGYGTDHLSPARIVQQQKDNG